MATKYIRNFSIIAHIDHGKSTLADRLLEMTGTISQREMEEQLLDTMELERERGITIKAQSARLLYDAKDGHQYTLNLIDTPGHVDFNYEVSRSLAACEGALLIVDATQGVEAQTLANVYLALEHDLEIIPIINKVDLPSADPERVCKEIEDIIGLDTSEAVMVSAKTGLGVDKVLEAIVEKIPEPKDESDKPLRALIFDSHFDPYKGAIANVRIMEGSVKTGDRIRMMSSGKEFEVISNDYKIPVVVPYNDEAKKLIAAFVGADGEYLPWEEKQRMLRELQKYTVGISEVQKECLNNAIYQISDEEILALSEGYYSNEVGVLEEPQMNFENY